MRADVHWNLHKGGYSIKYPGQPMQYASSVTMTGCQFVIIPSLLAKFEANPNRRTVHALVRGDIESYSAKSEGGERVRCNPFRWRCFVRDRDQVKVAKASRVILHADGRIETFGLLTEPGYPVHSIVGGPK